MASRKAALLAIGAIGAALVWGTPAVAAPAPTPTPTVHSGDVTTCEAAGLDGFVLATRELGLVSGGVVLVLGGLTLLLMVRRRRA